MRAELSDLVVELQTIAASTGERQLRAQRAAAAIARAGGYRWVGLYDVGACGRILYIDDLVTDERVRSRGFGRQLLDWLKEAAGPTAVRRCIWTHGYIGRPRTAFTSERGLPRPVTTLRRCSDSSMIACAVLLASAVLCSPSMGQGRKLPRPTGPHAVGLATVVLTDPARLEQLTEDSTDRREVVVQLWYPARSRLGSRASYFLDSASAREAFSSRTFETLAATRVHALRGVAPMVDRGLPLVLVSPAVGLSPANYAAIGEDLASHGFVVAVLGHPYENPVLRLANGSLALPPRSGPDDNPLDIARRRIMTRAADLRFVLTRLIDSASQSVPGLRTDARNAVVVGHSRGAVAALEACKRDERFRACVNMDGGVLGGPYYEDSTGAGPRAPTLWLQAFHPPPSDSLLAAWRMSRVQWDSFDLRANRLLARARGGGWRVTIPDTAHMAFSDLEFLLADSAQKDSALATLGTVRQVLRTFVDATSRGAVRDWGRPGFASSHATIQRIPESTWPQWGRGFAVRIDSLVSQEWSRDTTGGVVLGVVLGDSLVWSTSRGYADIRSRRAMTPDRIFRIGSITKQFTALMLLQMVRGGQVAMTDPVERLVPEARALRRFYPNAPPITLFQLATHTSGLAREPDDERLAQGPSDRWDTLVVRGLTQVKVLAEPGTAYRYSNFGYALLGLALSQRAGERYEAYIARHILQPLGMVASGFHSLADSLLATGYDWADGAIDARTPALEHRGRGYKVPNGALYSTLGDLARFVAFEMKGGPDSVLPRETLDSNYRRIVYANRGLTDAAGLGFVLVRQGDVTAFGHAGTVAGYDAITGFDPERRIAVIVLRNVSSGNFDSYRLLMRSLTVLREARNEALERPLH